LIKKAVGEYLLIKPQVSEVDTGKIAVEALHNKKTRPGTGLVLSVGNQVKELDPRLERGRFVEFNPNTGKTTEDGLLIQNFHNIYCIVYEE
jgi:hypothetical protein